MDYYLIVWLRWTVLCVTVLGPSCGCVMCSVMVYRFSDMCNNANDFIVLCKRPRIDLKEKFEICNMLQLQAWLTQLVTGLLKHCVRRLKNLTTSCLVSLFHSWSFPAQAGDLAPQLYHTHCRKAALESSRTIKLPFKKYFLFFWVLGIKSRILYMPGTGSTTEPHCLPWKPTNGKPGGVGCFPFTSIVH